MNLFDELRPGDAIKFVSKNGSAKFRWRVIGDRDVGQAADADCRHDFTIAKELLESNIFLVLDVSAKLRKSVHVEGYERGCWKNVTLLVPTAGKVRVTLHSEGLFNVDTGWEIVT